MSLFSHDADPDAETGPLPWGFNWGAFLFAPLFLSWYRRFGAGLLLFGINVAASLRFGGPCLILVALPLSLCVGLYVGFKANEIAWETQRFRTYDALKRSMFGWNLAGAASVLLVVIRILMK